MEHQGIKVQLLGQIELASERGHPHDFVSLGALLPGSSGRWASLPACCAANLLTLSFAQCGTSRRRVT